MLVKNRMSRNVVSVTPDTTLYEVMKTVEDNHFDGVPIVEDGRVLGVIDERVIMREFCACCAIQNREAGIDVDMPIPFASAQISIEPDKRRIAHFLHRRTVRELVLPDEEVITVSEDAPIEQASYLMFCNEIDLLPVIDNGGKLTGVISKGDILRVFDEIFGYGAKGGDRVMIAVPDVVGRIAEVTGLMKRNHININSIVATQTRIIDTVLIIMKVERGKGDKAKKVLEQQGFKLIHPEMS
ncbi:MAG: CBS domain-containing protein [Firmicutes bacterium]|nr:CBS domain-containing protein [Bacillota bacterium]